MFAEPTNSFIVMGVCIVGALHFGGCLPTSKTSPALNWAREKHPRLPKATGVTLMFVALVKLINIYV